MTEQEHPDQDSFLLVLVAHHQKLRRNTLLSGALYALFVIISLIVAFDNRPLQDPLTLASIGLFVISIAAIPRTYVPRLYEHKAKTIEDQTVLDSCRNLQRMGIYQRMVYFAIALVTIGLIPWFMRRHGL